MGDKLHIYYQESAESDEGELTLQAGEFERSAREFHPLDSDSDYSMDPQIQRYRDESLLSACSHSRRNRAANKPPSGVRGGRGIAGSPEEAHNVQGVYQELQDINKKLKEEFSILNERSELLKKKEQEVAAAERDIERRIESEIERRMADRDQQIAVALQKAENLLKEKVKENKRLQENFNTLKISNEALKKELDSLQHQHEKLEKQSQSLQSRLINLQRKQEFEERKEANLPPDLPKAKAQPKKDGKDKQNKGKVQCLYEVMSTLLEWVSEFHLRQAVCDQPTKQAACPTELVQDKTLKTFPVLVDILKEACSSHSRFVLPCMQYMYWSLLHLEQGKTNQKTALSSTLRRLGEELYRPRLQREDTERPQEAFFFHSHNLHVQFLSCLLILKTITQVDHLAHVFEVLRNSLKTDSGKELFVHYQATPVLLQHLKPTNKTLLSASVDTHLQMSMESQTLPAFLDSCSTEAWFRAVSTVWKSSGTEHKILEKVSILLQKLSKYKSNRKYFEVFGLVHSIQDMMRSLGNDQESAFLNLNLKSILFNLNLSKGVA